MKKKPSRMTGPLHSSPPPPPPIKTRHPGGVSNNPLGGFNDHRQAPSEFCMLIFLSFKISQICTQNTKSRGLVRHLWGTISKLQIRNRAKRIMAYIFYIMITKPSMKRHSIIRCNQSGIHDCFEDQAWRQPNFFIAVIWHTSDTSVNHM